MKNKTVFFNKWPSTGCLDAHLEPNPADNRPFAGSGHMVRNKLHWDANDAVGLPKQRKVGLDC